MNKLFAILGVLSAIFPVNAQELYFPSTVGNDWDTIAPSDLGWCADRIYSLYGMLEENDTHAFIILKDGKIVLEKYFAPFGQDSIWYWASAGKSLTAFLVGIAQEQGHLLITDTTSDYLGQGWSSCSANEDEMTIRHQLTMTTGFDDGVEDPYCTMNTCLVCLAEPGTRWAYHNAPYTLLDGVIGSAANQSLNGFLQTRVTDLTGINGLFLPVGYNNVFFSKARSMARFGLLMLNKGKWGNVDILGDSDYYDQMVSTSQEYNKAYGYLWWLNGKESYMIPGLQFVFSGSLMPNAPDDMIAALGKNGQYINVVPSQNLVVIRMGDAPSSVEVPFLLNDKIWEYINDLECFTATNNLKQVSSSCSIYPNPSSGNFKVNLPGHAFDMTLYNDIGESLMVRLNCKDSEVVNRKLPPVIYFLNIHSEAGSFVKKIVVGN